MNLEPEEAERLAEIDAMLKHLQAEHRQIERAGRKRTEDAARAAIRDAIPVLRRDAARAHPDAGGSNEAFIAAHGLLQEARKIAA